MTKVIIVGGGISGLASPSACSAVVPQAEITLLEKSDRCGGTVRTEQHAGFRVEAGPNGFLDTKTATTTLCRDLGLEGRAAPGQRGHGSQPLPVPEGTDATTSQRPRFLPEYRCHQLAGQMGSGDRAVSPLAAQGQDESIDTFARRRVGAEVAEVLADAMVTGIHGGDPTLLSMPAAFPRLAELEEQHGSVMKGLVQAAKQRRTRPKPKEKRTTGPASCGPFAQDCELLIDTLRDQLAHRLSWG